MAGRGRPGIAALGLALAAMAGPAEAGDLVGSAGVFKEPGGAAAIPVPVPRPFPETYNWYVRLDGTLGSAGGPNISERGTLYGTNLDPSNNLVGPAFGNSAGWIGNGTDWSRGFGLGIGYHFTPRFRGDVTLESRSNQQVAKIQGGYTYLTFDNATPPNTHTINGNVLDRTDLRGGIGLANIYVDLLEHSRFTPYVGAGLGVAVQEMRRSNVTSESETSACGGAAPQPACALGFPRTYSSISSTTSASLAAAAMAGLSYSLDEHWALDVGYRLLYVGGLSGSAMINGNQSTLKINDYFEHQVRAGVRLNVW